MSNNKLNSEVNSEARSLVGSSVRAKRKATGLTCEALSVKSGIRKATLINLELGRKTDIDTLISVTSVLGGEVTINWGDEDKI